MVPGITKCRKPKMSLHRGRTWDYVDLFLTNGDKAKAFLDTTWGRRFYFSHENQWYSGAIADFEQGVQSVLWFDLRKRDTRL